MIVHLATQASLSVFDADFSQTLLVVQGCTIVLNTPRQDLLSYCTCTHTCYEPHQTSQIYVLITRFGPFEAQIFWS